MENFTKNLLGNFNKKALLSILMQIDETTLMSAMCGAKVIPSSATAAAAGAAAAGKDEPLDYFDMHQGLAIAEFTSKVWKNFRQTLRTPSFHQEFDEWSDQHLQELVNMVYDADKNNYNLVMIIKKVKNYYKITTMSPILNIVKLLLNRPVF